MKCFLDRDGVINVDYPYVGTIERFEWCPDIIDILRILKQRGYQLIMITNQSGINRGLYTYKNFIDLSFYIHNELWNNELEIEINFCRHAPEEECKCRKPKTGMLDRYNIGNRDIFIGDKDTDMMTAYNGNTTSMVNKPQSIKLPVYQAH